MGISKNQKDTYTAQGKPGCACAPSKAPGSATPCLPPPPPQVSRHLAKLFDSLCKLKFRLDADEKPLKLGLGMFSKEDEYVDFDQECDLSGQVSAGAHPGRTARSPGHPAGTVPRSSKHSNSFRREFPAWPDPHSVGCILRTNGERRRAGERFMDPEVLSGSCQGTALRGPHTPEPPRSDPCSE